MSRLWHLVAVTGLAMSLCSCGLLTGADRDKTVTMNVDQAERHMQEIADLSINGVDPDVVLDRERDGSDYGSCLDPSDAGSEERVMLGRSFWIRGVEKPDHNAVVRQIKERWIAAGYTISKEVNLEQGVPQLYGLDTKDSFFVSVDTGYDGLLLEVGSPCLWFDGVPGHTFVDTGGSPVPPGTAGGKLVEVDP